MADIRFMSDLASRAECCEFDAGSGSFADFWRRATAEWKRSDVVFLEGDLSPLLYWCMIAAVMPRGKCALACADLLLPRPITWRDHAHAAVKRILLRYVDLIILFQKDFSEYQRCYGLRPEQLRHVPFKTNLLDITRSISPRDAGYYWSGGTTYRDWPTLSKALEGLDIPVVITIPDDEELRRRGEADDAKRRRRGVPAVVPAPGMFGSNVRIVRHGADPRSWIDWAAGARGVVLPIHPRTISSSGVSTYLTAMALRKPLIISEVASTIGILDQSTAMLVPPADPAALRNALLTLDGDPALRRQLAEASYRYAASASDTARLHSDYLRLLLALAGAPVTDPEKPA